MSNLIDNAITVVVILSILFQTVEWRHLFLFYFESSSLYLISSILATIYNRFALIKLKVTFVKELL